MNCPRCQTSNPSTAQFCQNCGAVLAREEPVQRCPNCEMTLLSGARFCMNCGQPLRQSTPLDDARFSRLAAAAPAPLVEKVRAAGLLAGERRVVTALFVDVVGSTALGERMDDSDWAEIMNGALDRCYPVIYRYEGTVARLLGDELLAFFGAPVAHEDDPLRAVHAALELLGEMQSYAYEVRQEYGVEFAVRVSLGTGPVVIGPVDSDLTYEYSALGGAINLAAQVEAIKWPMKVLISEDTYRFVAPFFDCVDLGRIEAEGQIEPVRVYQVRGLRSEPDYERSLVSPMIGRDDELFVLLRLGDIVRAGLGRAVLIVGEPGLGKTRLIAEWAAASKEAEREAPTAGQPPLQWVKGRCLSYSRDLPYHLLTDLLRSLIGVSPSADEPETRAALLALVRDLFDAAKGGDDHLERDSGTEVYAYLGHLLSLKLDPSALERAQRLDPQALRAQYLAALRQLLRALAARRPLVLILENLHWADPSSIQLLIHLLPLVSSTSLLLCLVTRADRDAPGWKLVVAARETIGGSLSELTLDTLSERDSQHLIASLLQSETLPGRVGDLILSKAEGNPLFIEEVIRMLIDREAIRQEEERWEINAEIEIDDIPDSLQGLLLTRIDRLPDEAKHALRVASVIGRQFPVGVLERVLGEEQRETHLVHHLSVLESAGLVRVAQVAPELAYRFRNVLVQEAAYASILPADRQRLHRAVGEVLEARYPEQLASQELAATLATHFSRAGAADIGPPGVDPRALKYYTLAGNAALATYANQEAESHYRRALALSRVVDSSDLDQAHLLSGLGEALYWQSRFQDAILTWREGISLYRALGDDDSVARLYARSARAAWAGGDTPESLGLCQQGLAAVAEATASAGLALLVHEAARAYLFNGLGEESRPLCQRALDMAEHLQLVEVQAEVLATMGLLSDQPPEAALDVLNRAVELAEPAGLLSQAARAHVNLAALLSSTMADLRTALDHYRRAAELRRQRGDTAGELLSLGGVTELALKLGDFGDVESAFADMRSLVSDLADPGPAELVLRINEAMLLRFRGELPEAAERMRALQADTRQRDDLHNLIEVDSQLVDILLEFGVLSGDTRVSGLTAARREEAEVALTEALEICERWRVGGIHPRALMSEVRVAQGRFEEAADLLTEARKAAHLRPVGWEEMWLSFAEARASIARGQWAQALVAFEAAAGTCNRLGMRWWWARLTYEWAETHTRRGEPADLERARALFREALSMFGELGVSRYATLAEQKLQAVNALIHAGMLAHQQVARELAVAGRVQGSFLPAQPPHIPGWQLAATLEPARETSGDFYDFIPLLNGRWGIVVADVADKGVGAALYMALTRTLIRTYAAEYATQPELTLKVVNRRIMTETASDMFITAFYGVIDPFEGTLTYCNAGHNPPYLWSTLGPAQMTGAVRELGRTGLPLGILEDPSWTQVTVQLAPGDVLVLYSDGATDANNLRQEMFGEDRLVQAAQTGLGLPAQAMVQALLAEVHEFVGDAPRFDDMTLMVVIRGDPQEP